MPTKPKAAPDFDLDAVLAEEETRAPFRFTFDGKPYELPASIDIRAIAAISAGRLDDGLRLLLNPDQWQAIQDSPKMLTSNALRQLFDTYTAFADGATAGESSASTGS